MTDEQIKALYAEATGYARSLAAAITYKHFPENTGWKPLPDLIGILTQIDNATCGLVRAQPVPSTDELDAIRARHRIDAVNGGLQGIKAQAAHRDRATLLRLLDAERARRVSEWQDISTAPKDGTEVDLWVTNRFGEYRMPNCKWGVEYPGAEGAWMNYKPHPDALHDWEWQEISPTPIAWQPLPAPPALEEKAP